MNKEIGIDMCILLCVKGITNEKVYYAAAAKSLQSCLTLCNPIDGSPPGSAVPGISRQEHWSGLPFPSPMHENEKRKWSRSVVPDSLRPHGLQPTRLLPPWDFPGKSTGVGCHCLLWRTYYTSQVTWHSALCWPKWEGHFFTKRVYMYTFSWFTSLFKRN